MIMRKLKITPSQWDAEPWWSQRMLMEELRKEIEQEEKDAKRQKRGGKGTGSLGGNEGSSRVDASGDLSNSPFSVKRV